MADSVTPDVTRSVDDSTPYYGDISSKKKRLVTRIFAAVTIFLVFLAVVFCLVKGSHHRGDYLLAANILLTSLIVSMLTWWYYKSILPPEKYAFMIFVALCLIFQSIVTDIFVWQRKVQTETIHGGGAIPSRPPPNETTLVPPHH